MPPAGPAGKRAKPASAAPGAAGPAALSSPCRVQAKGPRRSGGRGFLRLYGDVLLQQLPHVVGVLDHQQDVVIAQRIDDPVFR